MSKHVEIISQIQDHSYVEAYYENSDESHFWFQWRVKAMLAQLAAAKISTDKKWNVLDVGGGVGVVRKQIESATNWDVDLTELDYKGLCTAEPGRGRTLYYDIMEEREEFKERYDAIVLFDVLEHIKETKPFLHALANHLKPSGILIINVPALQSLYSNYDKAVGHFKRYGKNDAESELNDAGFKVIDMRYWGFALAPIALLRKLYLSSKATDSSNQISEQGFKPPSEFVNSAFKKIMSVETTLTKTPPLGSSLLVLAQKTDIYANKD